MRKFVSLALSALLACSCIGGAYTGAAAEEYDSENDEGAELFASAYSYTTNSDGTITITGFTSATAPDTTLSVPASFAGKKVTAIGDNAFCENANLTSVSFAGATNLTKIGANAFAYCPALTTVTFSSTNSKLTTICDSAFYNDTALRTVNGATAANLPNLIYFGSSVFSLTPFLYGSTGDFVTFGKVLLKYKGTAKDVVLPSGIESIADAFFESKITSIDLSAMRYVGSNAFSNCKYLSDIGSLENCTGVGDMAFSGCSSLTDIEYGEDLETVGFCAFSGCNALESFTCSGDSGLVGIGECAFWNCSALSDFDFGSLAYVNVGSFWNCFDGDSADFYRIPDSVSVVCEGGYGNIGFDVVVVPESVEAIAPAAFGASSLSKIYSVNNSDVFNTLKGGAYAQKTYAFGDMNADGKVIYLDIVNILNAIATGIGTDVTVTNVGGDYNGDGVITLADVNSIMNSLG